MDICEATREYETWMAGKLGLLGVKVFEKDLKDKHKEFMEKGDAFSFLRATFYRWLQRFPELCPQAWKAPAVLSVGDLHANNFGAWRDAHGVLVWGINDFDEAAPLPYTQDLIRLATSVGLGRKAAKLKVPLGEACEAILKGYSKGLRTGGGPFVVDSEEKWLKEAYKKSKKSKKDFRKERRESPAMEEEVPLEVRTALAAALPSDTRSCRIRHRKEAGVGSLGRPRYTAVAKTKRGWAVREAKALIPSAVFWAKRLSGPEKSYYEDVLAGARRRRDPHVYVSDGWVLCARARDIGRIEIDKLGPRKDERRFLRAMGRETANVHLGTPGAVKAVFRDLDRRGKGWLKKNAQTMMEDTMKDRRAWKKKC